LTPVAYKVHRENMKRRLPTKEKVAEARKIVQKTQQEVGHTRWTFAKETLLLDAIARKVPTVPVEIQVVQIGPVAFITNPAEYFCQAGLEIKSNSPFEYTFIAMLTNGCVGYVPTRQALSEGGGGYETRLTSYSSLYVGAAERMAEIGITLARELNPGKAPAET